MILKKVISLKKVSLPLTYPHWDWQSEGDEAGKDIFELV